VSDIDTCDYIQLIDLSNYYRCARVVDVLVLCPMSTYVLVLRKYLTMCFVLLLIKLVGVNNVI